MAKEFNYKPGDILHGFAAMKQERIDALKKYADANNYPGLQKNITELISALEESQRTGQLIAQIFEAGGDLYQLRGKDRNWLIGMENKCPYCHDGFITITNKCNDCDGVGVYEHAKVFDRLCAALEFILERTTK